MVQGASEEAAPLRYMAVRRNEIARNATRSLPEYKRLMCISSRRLTAMGPSHVSHEPLSCLCFSCDAPTQD